MNKKASIWTSLRNPAFRRFWLATVISGSCVAAHNTAAYWALSSLGAATVLISLMTTVSALPGMLFTVPAGALADRADRKKILGTVQLWQATIAIGLTILWLTHLLNPYFLLASAFLFNVGFAFSSPAQSVAIAEMVSPEESDSAYTLSGLQMDVSGIVGPLLSGMLIPLIGASFIFGANGVGFLFLLLAILQWKRVRPPSTAPLENFFEAFTTAIRYVRYTPGIRILLARHALFSLVISIIPALLPVVGLKVLHLPASHLGYLFTSMAVGSVLVGVFVISWARAHYSSQRITTGANLFLVFVYILMVCVHGPYAFLGVAALAGAGWTLSASELWVASQRAIPDWARGRMNATITMVAQGATALGGAIWGTAAHTAGVTTTFLAAAGVALAVLMITRMVPAFRLSIDFTTHLSFKPAPIKMFSHDLDPRRLPAPPDGPVRITEAFQVDPTRRSECVELMHDVRLIFLRNGAYRWHLYEDLNQPSKFRMEVVVTSWQEYLLQRERRTKNEKEVFDKLRRLLTGPNPPGERVALSVDKEVCQKRARSPGLAPDQTASVSKLTPPDPGKSG